MISTSSTNNNDQISSQSATKHRVGPAATGEWFLTIYSWGCMYTFNPVWIRENSNLCANSIFFNSLKMYAVRCTLEKEKFIIKILKTQNCYDVHAPDECMLTFDHNCRCCLQACEMQRVWPLSIKKILCAALWRYSKRNEKQPTGQWVLLHRCQLLLWHLAVISMCNWLYQNNKSFLSYLNEVSVWHWIKPAYVRQKEINYINNMLTVKLSFD